MIKFDFNSYMKKDINLDIYNEKIEEIKSKLQDGKVLNDWYDIDKCISKEEITDIIKTSDYIKKNGDVLIVIGIGGSYLGSKAIIDALSPYYLKEGIEVLFVGTSLSSYYLEDLKNYIKDKSIFVNVISKSGTTLEPLIAFEFIKEELKKRYSEEELRKRIIVTTDEKDGFLRKEVMIKNYKSYALPSNIGGRYSVLTVCGLLPIAVAGFDINSLLDGAKSCNKEKSFKYATIRNYLYNQGKIVESFTVYEPKLKNFTEWLKQLFAETEGKEGRGILPISAINTTDLHSLGQFYQEGNPIIFETIISVLKTTNIDIKKYDKQLDVINRIAAHKVAEAHYKASNYSNFIEIGEINEFSIGYLVYFFEIAAATSAYLIDVNPFNQPGVNEYKNLINKELNDENK
ncbi:MAG: glucose-6-phosphate isomerase [Bacilli bacterium]|nr:glucose-6-phosphate isomerase [Bacilli bacterium]